MNINETIPMMPSAEIAPGLELIPHEDNQVEAQKFTLLQNQELVGVIKLVLQKEKTARLVSAADNSHLPHSVPVLSEYAFRQAGCDRMRVAVPNQDAAAKAALAGLGFRLAEVHLARKIRVFDRYADSDKKQFPPVPVDPDRLRKVYPDYDG
jgi:hypothetical protein